MFEINTSEIDNFINELKTAKAEIESGSSKISYYQHLKSEINISGRLDRIITEEVYKKDEPSQYERTRRLLDAIKTEVIDGRLHLFLDDDYLENDLREASYEAGQDPDVHAGGSANKTYAERVEYGYVYENKNQAFPNQVRMDGRGFMQKTYEELLDELTSDKIRAEELLWPLLRRW